MAQDIRELLKQDKALPSESLPIGHETRFLERLQAELPVEKTKKHSYKWLQIAASIAIVLSVSLTAYFTMDTKNTNPAIVNADVNEAAPVITKIEKQSALAKISPDFKKVEEYYTNSIKLELTNLDVNDTNKELIDSFMKRLEELDLEYERLNTELLEVGANEETVQALITNLQLRLELMLKLKEKLNKLKELEDETYQDQQA